jgi:L-ascorbate metabolism protein UlaG (beta-lactamase superfamily)
MSETLYLRPNIVVEPLIDNWYAWPHLISPATAAMNIVERHLKIMESYVRAPQVHAAAASNPAMLGGPFIDYQGKRVADIQALIQETKRDRAHMIAFAAAIRELDQLLRNEGKGFSLEPLYSRVPERLRGYVELVYDLNNNATFRLIEPLLYRSEYYNDDRQSLMLSVINQDERPFVLSTPRLKSEGEVHLKLPFKSAGIDELFKMKRTPQTFEYIKEKLECDREDEELLRSFLTPEAPKPYQRYAGPGIRWRYFGHACILVETKDVAILFDPVLSYTYDNHISRYTYDDLPDKIDYVVITHNHQDHILFETMLQIRSKVKHIVVPRNGGGGLQDPSLRLMFENVGFRNIIELDEFQSVPVPTGELLALPFFGEHCDLFIRTKLAYLVRLGERSLLFGADSCNIEFRLYDHIRKEIGEVDALFLGMECDGGPLSWLYGPLLTKPLDRKMDQSRRLSGSNYERAIDIVNKFDFKNVYVYAMGQEPWLNYIMSIKYTEQSNPIQASNRLIADCRARGIDSERLFGEKEIFLPTNGAVQRVLCPA